MTDKTSSNEPDMHTLAQHEVSATSNETPRHTHPETKITRIVSIAEAERGEEDSARSHEKKQNTLHTRLKLGSIMLTAILGLLAIDHFTNTTYFFLILMLGVTVVGQIEFYRMARQAGARPWWFLGTVFGVLMLAGQWALFQYVDNPRLQAEGSTAILVLFLISIMTVNVLLPDRKRESQNVAITTFGILYIPFFLSFYIKIRLMPGGESMILMIFLGSKCTDIGAYLIGRAYGSIKLIPKVSPGKTVEGAAGGLFAGVAATLLVYFLSGDLRGYFPLPTAIFLGCLIALLSMGGDLFESLLKRRFEVKDSAALVPAFGGMMDMIDSLLLNGPVLYFIIISANLLSG